MAGFLERFEGMRAQLPGPLTVTGNFELGRFGSLDLSVGGRLFNPTQLAMPGMAALMLQDLNNRSRILLDDASNTQNPNPIPYKDANNTRRVGDTLASLAGVLSGSFGAYRIHPTVPLASLAFQAGNPRPPTPDAVGGSVRVATANVLNYFTTLDTGAPVCGPTGGLDCRGANTPTELARQRAKILNELVGLDADIYALIEIENNASAATADLVAGLNDRVGAGTYSFIDTGTIGTDAIKLAFIYRTTVVKPVGPWIRASSTPRTGPRWRRPSRRARTARASP
jgi:predicted extracellular nuclease